ncbi:OmpA family protein [Dyadobacter sp. 32]|jgi:chemotaxis protein MotB|uniref:OmpA family protein n=1 Tax=Dyadobacter sp. 32 TaxID=538966 RepID=UPI0011EC2E9C
MKNALLAVAMLFVLASCGKKKLLTAQNKINEIQIQLDKARADLNDCDTRTASLNNDLKQKNDELASKNSKLQELEEQIAFLKKNNNNLLDRMSDLSVISKEGSESIKKSLAMMDAQGSQIRDLNSSIQRKDSLNMALVLNLKRSLQDVSDEDVQIEVKKGVVYVSLSDKMLFRSGSSVINTAAEAVLSKVAKILNDYKEIEILIEGHTDNVPIATDRVSDNWDLSVLRATSVARTLQKKYGVEPVRMIAGGRGEYLPKAPNDSAANKSLNRRTEIIITPKLDQFFNLYTPQAGK